MNVRPEIWERIVEKMGGPALVRKELIELIVATNLDPVPLAMAAVLDACDRMDPQ